MLQSVRSFFRKHTLSGCLILAALLILSVVCAVGIGPVFIPFRTVWRVILNRQFGLGEIADIDENTRNIIWTLRTPRVLEDALIGMSLTLSGISMQAFTRNPLASPYVLGISSGSYLGAVVAMTTSVFSVLGSYRTEAGAFCGAMFSIITVYLMAKTGTDVAPIRLVLVGMAGVRAVLGGGQLHRLRKPGRDEGEKRLLLDAGEPRQRGMGGSDSTRCGAAAGLHLSHDAHKEYERHDDGREQRGHAGHEHEP